jgi:hypothetical protein
MIATLIPTIWVVLQQQYCWDRWLVALGWKVKQWPPQIQPAEMGLISMTGTTGDVKQLNVGWTTEQDDQLRELAQAGETISKIAAELNRSRGSVRIRAAKLKITLAKSWKSKLNGGWALKTTKRHRTFKAELLSSAAAPSIAPFTTIVPERIARMAGSFWGSQSRSNFLIGHRALADHDQNTTGYTNSRARSCPTKPFLFAAKWSWKKRDYKSSRSTKGAKMMQSMLNLIYSEFLKSTFPDAELQAWCDDGGRDNDPPFSEHQRFVCSHLRRLSWVVKLIQRWVLETVDNEGFVSIFN